MPYEDKGGSHPGRYYQDIAIELVLEAIANNNLRLLLTLATGTGKTFIAFQIAWKLFHSRWNLSREPSRRPRILFLADRNILANQAFNAFSAFPEDALVRISPDEIKKKGKVPKNGSIFFTIFQTFMSGPVKDGKPSPYFGEYPPDFFDFIIIDECHRGGANDEGNWRGIMDYFAPAVQLGLTATPKRQENADTYKYFGDPVYIYSLKEGINDGFLTPFKVKQIQTTLDYYVYTPDDTVVEGEIEAGKLYDEPDFNRNIEIREREKKRVEIFMSQINQNEKTLVFCANQSHALLVRDLINQLKKSSDANYCQRVTANDGALGEQHLRDFQDNEKSIPTILTTSQKLSTGVDARNIRNIVLTAMARASVDDLCHFRGVGPDKAVTLVAAFTLASKMAEELHSESPVLDNPEAVAQLLRDKNRTMNVETFQILLLNARRRLIRVEEVSQGILDTILVHPREVFNSAIAARAAAIVLVHNHPSGDPTPSEADIKVTRDLIRAGQLLKIEVLDHVVLGRATPERPKDYASLRELGYFL